MGCRLLPFHFFVNIEQRLGLPELAARWGALSCLARFVRHAPCHLLRSFIRRIVRYSVLWDVVRTATKGAPRRDEEHVGCTSVAHSDFLDICSNPNLILVN